MLRKQTYSKQPNLASSKSQEENLSDTFYEDNEDTALLGKIIFNLELDQQEEQGNKGGFHDNQNEYQFINN